METTNTSILVGLLTEEQKNELVGQQFSTDCYFNPIQDDNENWVISIEEMTLCINNDFMWVQALELIPFVPKTQPIPQSNTEI